MLLEEKSVAGTRKTVVASALAANRSKKVGKIVPKVQGDPDGESLFPYKADKFLHVR